MTYSNLSIFKTNKNFILIFKTNNFPDHRDNILMNFPVVKKLYRKSVVVKFARALSILTKSGMPIQTSLDMIIPLISSFRALNFKDLCNWLLIQNKFGIFKEASIFLGNLSCSTKNMEEEIKNSVLVISLGNDRLIMKFYY